MSIPLQSRPTVLKQNPRDGLREFLSKISSLGVRNVADIGRIASDTIRNIKGDEAAQQRLRDGELMRQWYASLQSGKPDYSVYASPIYLAELWACWHIYSRKYLAAIPVPRNLAPHGIANAIRPVRRVIDLGCGCGYTAAAFRELFPEATVIGTNISGTVQYQIAQQMSRQYGFSMVPEAADAAGDSDLVFASEYFEHIHAPITHLHEVVRSLRPRFMLIANAFGTTAIGHFDTYIVGNTLVPGKNVQRLFNAELRRLGYCKIKTKLWNNRPSFWARS
jgi:SAM-dependent methyltransferase